MQIASHRRALAPRAVSHVTTARPHAPLILFISGVHATAGRRRRTDGGQEGSPSLFSITKSYSSENRPSLLVVNGDLIDRGNVEEWATIAPALQRFREYGTRVIIAPGNHDIATAYESSAAAHLRRSPFGYVRSVESKKVIEFLKQAAIFEPELRCDDGRLLSTAVRADAKAIAVFENEWKATLEEARTIVQSVAGIIGRAIERSGPRIVFRMLAKATPEEHIRLIVAGDPDRQLDVSRTGTSRQRIWALGSRTAATPAVGDRLQQDGDYRHRDASSGVSLERQRRGRSNSPSGFCQQMGTAGS